MATDNTILNPGGGGDTIRTDDIDGIKFPASKITHGNDGVDDGFVSAANPLPVIGAAALDGSVVTKSALGPAIVWGHPASQSPIPVTKDLWFNGLLNAQAHHGQVIDLGSEWDQEYEVYVLVEAQANPAVGGNFDLYLASSWSPTLLPAQVGYRDQPWSYANRSQLAQSFWDNPAGQPVVVSLQALALSSPTIQMQAPSLWRPQGRYVVPVVNNGWSAAVKKYIGAGYAGVTLAQNHTAEQIDVTVLSGTSYGTFPFSDSFAGAGTISDDNYWYFPEIPIQTLETGGKLTNPGTGDGLQIYKGGEAGNVRVKLTNLDATAVVAAVKSSGCIARYSGYGDRNYYLGVLERSAAGVFRSRLFWNNNGTLSSLNNSVNLTITGPVDLQLDVSSTSLTLTVAGVVRNSITNASIPLSTISASLNQSRVILIPHGQNTHAVALTGKAKRTMEEMTMTASGAFIGAITGTADLTTLAMTMAASGTISGFIPSSLGNMRFWWDVALGQAYEGDDKSGHNPPLNNEFIGYLASQVNPSGTDLEHTFQSDEGNHHRPIYKTSVLNSLDVIEAPVQSDNSRNAVLGSYQNTTWDNTSDIMVYIVAKSTLNFASDNNSRVLFTFGNPGGGNLTGIWAGFKDKKFLIGCHGAGGPYREFGTGDNNWHVWTIKMTHGVNVLSGNALRLYIDGTELTSGTDFNSGNDGHPNPSTGQRFYWMNYAQGAQWDTMFYGQSAACYVYEALHNDTDRNTVEAYLATRFGL